MTARAAAATCCLTVLFGGYGVGCSNGATIEPPPPELDGGAADTAPAPFDAEPSVADATSRCPPGDAAAFVPQWAPPGPFYRGVCNDDEIQVAMACALIPGTTRDSCTEILRPGHDPCRACLMTPLGAAQSGPIIVDDAYARLNVVGCVWNAAGNERNDTCLKGVAAREDCAAAACRACRQTTVAIHDGCIAEARTSGPCASVAVGSPTCLENYQRPDGPGAICNPGADFMANAVRYGHLFCGSRPTDAGTD